jgi:hypothetical protein
MTTVARRAFAALALLAAPTVGFAQDPAKADYDEALSKLQADFERRLAELEKKVAATPAAKPAEKAEKKWYDRIGLRGYTQLRYTTLFNKDMTPDLVVPADSTVSETDGLGVRRGRFIFSGDVSEHVYLYAQFDMFGSVGGAGDKGLQNRDLYADIAFDADKEYRVRLGQSKVPFGFVNLQSSQNRAAMERPDALNSAVEGERDYGAYFMATTAWWPSAPIPAKGSTAPTATARCTGSRAHRIRGSSTTARSSSWACRGTPAISWLPPAAASRPRPTAPRTNALD